MNMFALAVALSITSAAAPVPMVAQAPLQPDRKPMALIEFTARLSPRSASIEIVAYESLADAELHVWGVDGLELGIAPTIRLGALRQGEHRTVEVPFGDVRPGSLLAASVTGQRHGRRVQRVVSFGLERPAGAPVPLRPSAQSLGDKRVFILESSSVTPRGR